MRDDTTRDGGSGYQDESEREPTLEKRGTRPIAHIEIFLDSKFVLHVRVDGMSLMPISPPAGDAIDYRKLARDVEERLRGLTQHHGTAGKLPSYSKELRHIGLVFGGLLFGYRDVLQLEQMMQAGQWRNELDRTFEQLYHEARRRDGFVSVSFAADSKIWSQLPWELAIWRQGGEESHIGVAEHLAFVRRVHHPGFTIRTGDPAQSGMILRHLSSILAPTAAPDESSEDAGGLSPYQHGRIEHHLAHLAGKYGDQLARVDAIATTDWQDWHEEPVDILQFFGHGAKSRYLEWLVEHEGHDAGLQIGTRELLGVLQRGSVPQLFVLISCYSFGFIHELLQRAAGKRAVAGLGMIGEWKSLTAHNEHLVRAFYSRLFEHGRLDLAIQETRRAMYHLELASSLSPGARVPENWYRPVVILRDVEAAGHFQRIARDRLSDEARAITRGGPEADEEREQIAMVLKSLRKLGAPTTPGDFHRQGAAFQQALQDLDLYEFEELDTLRWDLVKYLAKALSPEEQPDSLESTLR